MKKYYTLILLNFSFNAFWAQIPDIEGNYPPIGETQYPNKRVSEIQSDFNLLPGFPIIQPFGVNTPRAGVVTANLDADQALEIIYGALNVLNAKNIDGTNVLGFPVSLGSNESIVWAPAVGDIDGDLQVDIIFTSTIQGGEGRLYAINIDGTIKAGFPNLSMGVFPQMAILGDVDLDGNDEIICSRRVSTTESYQVVMEGDGSNYPGWPFDMQNYPGSSAALGDIDGDGTVEIVSESRDYLWAWDKNGNIRAGFPFDIDPLNVALNSYAAPILVDLNKDLQHEIVFSAHGPGGITYVLDNNGSVLPGWPQFTPNNWIYGSPIAADLDGDLNFEIYVSEYGSGGQNSYLYGYNIDGSLRPNFPIGPHHGSANQITMADLDGDNIQDLILDQNYSNNGQGQLIAFNANGLPMTNWPLSMQYNNSFCQPVLVDIMRHDSINLIIQGNDFQTNETALQVFTSNKTAAELNVLNPFYGINEKHSGYYPLFLTNQTLELNPIKTGLFYPNPSSGLIYANQEPVSLKEFQIISLTGNVLFRKKQLTNSTLDLSSLEPGMYLIRYNTKQGPQTERIVLY